MQGEIANFQFELLNYLSFFQVAEYHIKHGDEEIFINPDTLHERRIVLKAPKDNLKIEGRIKYEGYDWTPWVSSAPPVLTSYRIILSIIIQLFQIQERQEGLDDGVLVPVIVMSVVAVIIICLAVILFLRTRNISAVKYDQEKVEGSKEENKMLTDDNNGKD